MNDFSKGDKVCVTDYPFGKCIKCTGIIVGVLENDYYNILVDSGFHKGLILKKKYWKLQLIEDEDYDES